MTFSEKMLDTVKKYNMLQSGDSVLVALSGGADSVSLFLGILEIKDMYNLSVSAAHINHCLRGKDADSDMEFVENLCEKHHIPIHILKKDVAKYSSENSCSLEESGRRVRYEFFNSIIAENTKIATAHTKNDNSENFFISALRGTNICGIPPVRGNIIRPLIDITKDEIYKYLEEKKQDFCVDKTNFTEDYFRNKVRLKLIPFIEKEFNTDIAEILGNNLDVTYFENDFIESTALEFIKKYSEKRDDEITLNISEFLKCHIAVRRKILRKIYYDISENNGYISYTHIENIINMCEKGMSGKELPLCGKIIAEISFDKLIVKKICEKNGYYYSVGLNESAIIFEAGIKITLSDKKGKYYFTSDEENFTVRTRKNGDKIYIKNVGHKKLSDFFTDKKVRKSDRDIIPVIADTKGICAVGNMYYKREEKEKNIYIEIEYLEN